MLQTAKRVYKLFISIFDKGQSPFLLFVRLYWGWQLAQSGWGKLHNLEKVTEYFQSINVPMAHMTAISVSSLELIGGVLLFVGLASRIIALPLTINMVAAYYFGDREALFAIFSDPGKFYVADPFTFLLASAIVLFFGAGVFSLDYWIGRLLGYRGDEREVSDRKSAAVA
jgi:putative oxidoreductase